MGPTRSIDIDDTVGRLEELVDEVADNGPLIMRGDRQAAVLVSAEDWDGLVETLALSGMPGMSESIRRGMAEPWTGCASGLDW